MPQCGVCPQGEPGNPLRHDLRNDHAKSLLQKETPLKPALLQLFENDAEQVSDFLDSLSKHERSIIDQSNDPRLVLRLKLKVEDDIRQTAKDLEMDD